MNDVAKKCLCDRLINAIQTEGLVQREAANIIGISQSDVSNMKNERNWRNVREERWEAVQKWANSGLSLHEYGKKSHSGGIVESETRNGEIPGKEEPSTEIENYSLKPIPISILGNSELKEVFARSWLEMLARGLLVPFMRESGYSGKLTKEIVF